MATREEAAAVSVQTQAGKTCVTDVSWRGFSCVVSSAMIPYPSMLRKQWSPGRTWAVKSALWVKDIGWADPCLQSARVRTPHSEVALSGKRAPSAGLGPSGRLWLFPQSLGRSRAAPW